MRQHRSSPVLRYVIFCLFGVLIAAFILSFGQQAGTGGCGSSQEYALEVGDTTVSVPSWRFAVNGIGLFAGREQPKAQRNAQALDGLIARVIMTDAAKERGIAVNDSVVLDALKAGELFLLGNPISGKMVFFQNGAFSYQGLENFSQNLGLASVDSLISEQKIEHTGAALRAMFMDTVQVSPEEVQTAYTLENTTVSADHLTFSVSDIAESLKLSEEDLKAFVKAHEPELKAQWELRKTLWSDDAPRILARTMMFKKVKPAAAEPDKATEKTPEPVSPADAPAAAAAAKAKAEELAKAKTQDASKDAGKTKAEAALARLGKGESFAKVAADSDDATSKHRGGLIGWRAPGSVLPDPSVTEKIAALKAGGHSELFETEDAYFIVQADEASDKALTYEQAALTIAIDTAPLFLAKAIAKKRAEAALASVQNKKLGEVFGTSGDEKLRPATNTLDLGNIDPALKTAGATTSSFTVTDPVRKSFGPAGRTGGELDSIGLSQDSKNYLFTTGEVDKVAPTVQELKQGDEVTGYMLVALTKRTEADPAEFEKQRADLTEAIRSQKAQRLFVAWLHDQCVSSAKAGKIKLSAALMTSEESKSYQACAHLAAM